MQKTIKPSIPVLEIRVLDAVSTSWEDPDIIKGMLENYNPKYTLEQINGALTHLVERGLVEESLSFPSEPENSIRYYIISDKGKEVLKDPSLEPYLKDSAFNA